MARCAQKRFDRHAKYFTAIWLAWIFVAELAATAAGRSAEVPVMLGAMVPFVVAGTYGARLWHRGHRVAAVGRSRDRAR